MRDSNRQDRASKIVFSARELECIKWCAEGKTYWEIGKILGVSERTVNFHLGLAKEKTQTVSVAHCVAVAIRGGFL